MKNTILGIMLLFVAISTQAQKSGDNTYNYILLRSPFMDAITGKKEIRIYFNKLEDYPSFKTHL
jgi:hypothetical protein